MTIPNYFSQIAGALDHPERLEIARRKGLKTVALIGVSLPEELFWACGAVPISLGRFVFVEQVANRSRLPRDVCAAVRTTFDLLANHWIPAGLVDAIVVAGGCDWIARLADRFEGKAPVWPLNVSRAATSNVGGAKMGAHSRALTTARFGSLEQMLNALELLTDLPLTRRAFDVAHGRVLALNALCDLLDRLRLESPPVIRTSDYYRITGSLDLADPQRWADEAQSLIRVFQSRIQTPKSKVQNLRVLLMGCPSGFPDSSLVEMIEQTGFQIVGEDFGGHGSSRRSTAPPRGGRRAILNWLAGTLKARHLANLSYGARGAHGVIRLHYRGCAVDAMQAARRKSLEADRDLAVLTIEIDPPSFTTEALRTRLEAFREQLLSRFH